MTRAVDKRIMASSSDVARWLKAWWFLIFLILGIIGGGITTWFKIDYVTQAINPERMVEWRTKQAVAEARAEFRWCLVKQVNNRMINPVSILSCAD